MQTAEQQRQANIARICAYHDRCAAWLKEDLEQFPARLKELDARYCRGMALRRQWRKLWAAPAASGQILACPGPRPQP